MGYNPANFVYWIGEPPWAPRYQVSYSISFYDSTTGMESPRSAWRVRGDLNAGRTTARRIHRRFEGEEERVIHELRDNITPKYQDAVR